MNKETIKSIVIDVLIMVVLAIIIGFGLKLGVKDISQNNVDTMTLQESVEDLNSEVDKLYETILLERAASKVENGELTEEMIENMTTEEIMAVILSD